MMKKTIKMTYIISLLAVMTFLSACDFIGRKQDAVPFVSNIRVATSEANLYNGVTVTSLKCNTVYCLGFSVYDEDMDVSKAYVQQTRVSDGYRLPEIELPLSQQLAADVTYHTSFFSEYPGVWKAEIYVVDDNGNRSNTSSERFVVDTSAPEISNLCLIDTETGIEPSSICINVTYQFCFDLTDIDLDASVAKVTITKPGELPVAVDVNLSKQKAESVIYYINDYFDVPGFWNVEIYVLDELNNKSNRLTKSFYVTE